MFFNHDFQYLFAIAYAAYKKSYKNIILPFSLAVDYFYYHIFILLPHFSFLTSISITNQFTSSTRWHGLITKSVEPNWNYWVSKIDEGSEKIVISLEFYEMQDAACIVHTIAIEYSVVNNSGWIYIVECTLHWNTPACMPKRVKNALLLQYKIYGI